MSGAKTEASPAAGRPGASVAHLAKPPRGTKAQVGGLRYGPVEPFRSAVGRPSRGLVRDLPYEGGPCD